MTRTPLPRLPRFLTLFLGAVLGLGASACAAESELDPMDWASWDWASWRGPEQNGISRETGLIDSFDPKGEGPESNVLWKSEELGGISTPVVLRGKLYTIVRHEPGTTREAEKVVCVDAATGKKLWENIYNVFLSDVPSERIGWSCCAADPETGNVYAIGACAYLQCLDGESGKTLWSRSLNEEFGFLTTYGGRLTTPVLFEDLVICTGVIIGWGETARPTGRLLAFDKRTGDLVWINGSDPLPEDTTYSAPVSTVLDGQAAIVFGAGDGAVYAWQPRTGHPIWKYRLSLRGLNVTPVVENNRVYMGQAEENFGTTEMGAIVCIDGAKQGEITGNGLVWRQSGMVGKSSPLVVDGRLYAFDDTAKLYVLDAETGEPIGRRPLRLVGTRLRSSPVYADGKIYICSENAWHVLEPTAEGAKIIHRMRIDDEIAGSPIVSHGRIYLPTVGALYCLGRADHKPAVTQRPPAPREAPIGNNTKPALVQVIPAEALIQSGQRQKFTVKVFNDRGQLLEETSADFELAGPGEIGKDGTFTAADTGAHTGTILTAKVGEATGRARIRVVPSLPWRFDFEDGEVPAPWVGARHRNVVREVDGNKAMVKITTIPKGTRSQLLMGPADLHDYTVQADVYGIPTNAKLPDAGVIAQRYTMDLMGDHQKIQIRSWTSQLGRFSHEVPFEWKGNTWYTIKFRAANEDGKAVLRGKVWPRDEQEPEDWTIEATDVAPNTVGSPGLFGNAQVSEILYDNIEVRPNQ